MKRTLLTFCLVSCLAVLQAQTLHFISIFDTNDETIGTGMKTERTIINNEMLTIAGCLEEFGYDSQFCDYYGTNCSRASLMQAINDLQIGSDDVVVFYYGGHGARAFNNEEDRFPQMCLGESNEKNWVPSTLVKNMIVQKGPRLTVVLTGCCNKEGQGVTIKSVSAQSSGYTSLAAVNKQNFEKLFLQSKGIVQLTSSQAGEYSWCIDQGSYFALALVEILKQVGEGAVEPEWQKVCQMVKDVVSSIKISGGSVKQTPDFEVSTTYGSTTPPKNDNTPTITRKVNDAEYDLAKDLIPLLDKSKSTNARLSIVPNILAKHFAAGAKVLTLGRDMQTVVDYEDAEVFLRRIAMSPFIEQINVIEQTEGKNVQITVHEVRTK